MLQVFRERKAREPAVLKRLEQTRQTLVDELDGLRAKRTSLGPAEQAELYRLGSGPYRLPAPSEAGKPLTRIGCLPAGFYSWFSGIAISTTFIVAPKPPRAVAFPVASFTLYSAVLPSGADKTASAWTSTVTPLRMVL